MTRDREEEPRRDDYPDVDPESAEEEHPLYRTHLLQYEMTQLRRIFHEKMQSLWPRWDLEVAENKMRRLFYQATHASFHKSFRDNALRWVEAVEAGELSG